jgi:hypothetical protein
MLNAESVGEKREERSEAGYKLTTSLDTKTNKPCEIDK